jgi:hypothetical protein
MLDRLDVPKRLVKHPLQEKIAAENQPISSGGQQFADHTALGCGAGE